MSIQSTTGQPNSPTGMPPDGSYQIAAVGDLKCSGGDCRTGGTYGTTAMYNVGGRLLCRECAVKALNLGSLPGGEQNKRLDPYLIQ
jgi:hypothetical protein